MRPFLFILTRYRRVVMFIQVRNLDNRVINLFDADIPRGQLCHHSGQRYPALSGYAQFNTIVVVVHLRGETRA